MASVASCKVYAAPVFGFIYPSETTFAGVSNLSPTSEYNCGSISFASNIKFVLFKFNAALIISSSSGSAPYKLLHFLFGSKAPVFPFQAAGSLIAYLVFLIISALTFGSFKFFSIK